MVALLAIVLTPVRGPAQVVRGTVVRDGAPVPGVVVQLLDSTSTAVARDLSDEGGAYRLLAPRPGTYRLAARRIGYAPMQTALFTLGQLTRFQLRRAGNPHPLASMSAR